MAFITHLSPPLLRRGGLQAARVLHLRHIDIRCSEQNRRKTVTQSFRGLPRPKVATSARPPATRDSRELLAIFFGRRSHNARRQDSCPLLRGATKANPVKTGDAKLRGYRTPCVLGRSSRRTSRRRGYAWLRQELGNGRRGARAARGVRTPNRSHS